VIPILRYKPNEPIKWLKARLEQLLVNSCLKRRIRGRAKKDYWGGEHQNPPFPFNIAPTTIQPRSYLRTEDYYLKHSTRKAGQ
jgi:hypothetical protein